MEIKRENKAGIFEYDLLLQIEPRHGRPIPEELKPKISVAYQELDDKVAAIFKEYEAR